MPDKHGLITSEDYHAPAGRFRILRGHKKYGMQEIVGEFDNRSLAERVHRIFKESYAGHLFALCDSDGILAL